MARRSELDFKFEDRPKWRSLDSERPTRSTGGMIDDIVQFRTQFRDIPEQGKLFCRENFSPIMAVDCIYHLNIGEKVGTQTKEGTEAIIQSVLDKTASSEGGRGEETEGKETMNTFKAMTKLHEIFHQEMDSQGLLTVEQVCEVHGVLMKGLHPNAGKPRTTEAYTVWNGCPRFYPDASTARDRLYGLIDCHNIYVSSLPSKYTKQEVEYVFKCAARLLFEFVDAHAFGDGNGRMCRLLANFVLNLITPFPVGLYYPGSNGQSGREDYINAIIQCHDNPVEGPCQLATMLVEGAWRGWKSLFETLQSRNQLLPDVSIGPLVLQKSALSAISSSVARILDGKDISVDKEDVMQSIREAVEMLDTTGLRPDEHIEHCIKVAPHTTLKLKVFH